MFWLIMGETLNLTAAGITGGQTIVMFSILQFLLPRRYINSFRHVDVLGFMPESARHTATTHAFNL